MGSKFFHQGDRSQNVAATTKPNSGLNMFARALGQPAYTARSAASNANKDLGALSGLNKAAPFGAVKGSSAVGAPPPKKE